MVLPPKRTCLLTLFRHPADPTDGQPKNQADADRDAQSLERLPLHPMNGLV
jgi:hypothetical protein